MNIFHDLWGLFCKDCICFASTQGRNLRGGVGGGWHPPKLYWQGKSSGSAGQIIMIGRAANFSGYRPKFYRYWSKNLGFRQVLTEICPKKFFLTSGVRKKFFYPYFLNVRKKFFNPLNGTLTKNFLATEGGGRSTKHFPAGRLRLSQGNHSSPPPPPPY